MDELDRELNLIPAPVQPPTFAASPEARKRVENLAMQSVIMSELELGNDPRDVSKENRGYDVESKDSETNRLRMIEVKGRVKGAPTVTITRNEIVTALNKPEELHPCPLRSGRRSQF